MSATTDPVVVHDVRLVAEAGALELSCAIRSGDPTFPDRMWFRVPESAGAVLASDAGAFLPPLLVAAMHRRRPLRIDGPVARGVLDAARRVGATLRSWSDGLGHGLADTPIEAAAEVDVPRGRDAGAFFSAGVDSFYTLLRNHERFPVGDSRRVSRVVVLHGFDLSLGEHAVHGELRRAADAVAGQLGLGVVPLATNARDAMRGLDFDRYGYGLAQAAVGYALAATLHTLFVASGGRPFAELAGKWYTGGPEVLGRWSEGPVEMVLDGLHVERSERIRYLARSPLALAHLRVCWENRGGAYNCGRCEKCLRTMLALRAAGALGRCATLPPRVDPGAVLALRLDQADRTFWHRMPGQLAEAGAEREVIEAVERVLDRSRWADSGPGRLDALASRALRAVGLSASRLASLDRRLLGGAAARSFRAWQRVAARRTR